VIYIGIDPGLTGAIATNDDGYVYDIPVVARGGVVKHEVDAGALAAMLRAIKIAAKATDDEGCTAVLERTSAMPGQGVGSMFSMGDTRGVIRGVLAALEIPYVEVAPSAWKAKLGLTGADKEASRALAKKLYPEMALLLARKKDHNRAEALLLAYYGRFADAKLRVRVPAV
jgi:crossover junction endodeoxyribonuclease RuvC